MNPNCFMQRSISAMVRSALPQPSVAQAWNLPGWAWMTSAKWSFIREAQSSASDPPSSSGPGMPWLRTDMLIPRSSMSFSFWSTSAWTNGEAWR